MAELTEDLQRATDSAIACRLMQQHYITAAQHDVWCRSRRGETIYSMRRDYPNEARGVTYSAMTLYRWCQEVDLAIKAARVVTAPAEEERERHSIAVASGHEVRDAANPTPAGRVSTEASSWDAQRLRAAGAIDRYSRKRA